jgi:DNA-binding sugar fermentation-stimulating protein
MQLLKLDNLFEGVIIKRPSTFIKSPYVADIRSIEIDEDILGHTPSLGCCGLSDINSSVLIGENKDSKSKPKNKAGLKCTHTVFLSIIKNESREQLIGIHPKLAEQLVESALTKNCLSRLLNIKKYRKETSIYIKNNVDSRFDFTGKSSGESDLRA